MVTGMTGNTPAALVVMGVSGSGKSTVAGLLVKRLGWDFQEGDDLHPPANLAKMAAGKPLGDEDRWPWLDLVGRWIAEQRDEGRPGIVTCSALKRAYRDRIRDRGGAGIVFVYLDGSREKIAERLAARRDHFMPSGLLDSQLETLEPPGADENVVVVSAEGTPQEIADAVVSRLGLDSAPR
jgi:carbohydrate kinase (thermoresistant glucokinase family)